jgi:hypothetical protein
LGCLYRNLHSLPRSTQHCVLTLYYPRAKPGIFLFIKTTTVFVMRKYDATL